MIVSFSADCHRKQNDIQDLKVQVYCYHIVKYITAVYNSSKRPGSLMLIFHVADPTGTVPGAGEQAPDPRIELRTSYCMFATTCV